MSCNFSAEMIDLQKYRLPKKWQQKEEFMDMENQNQATEPEQEEEKDYTLSAEEEEDDEPSFDELAFNKKPARKEKKEKQPKKPADKEQKQPVLPVWAAICISVLVVAVIVLGTLWAVEHFEKNETEGPTTPTQAPTVPIESKDYTGTADTLVANRDQVVATVGDRELTNAKLQVYYWMGIYDFISENSYYLPYIGLDYTKDLSTQASYFDAKMSWQEYFLKNALDMWQWYAVMNIAAENAEFKLSQEDQETLNNLRETLEKDAKENKYADGQAMVEHDMGVGATFDAYVEYYKETFIAEHYSDELWDGVKVTQADMDKYYEDNKALFDAENITKETMMASVRHILLAPEGEKDANGKVTATEDAWEACRQKAQKLLDEYLKGGKVDENAFAELAKKHTEDSGSKENGGLYAGFFEGQMVKPFEDWSFDASRKYGDTGLVKADFGYHIMFFVETEVVWTAYADYELRMEACNKVLEDLMEANPLEADYDKTIVSHVELGN